MVGWNAGAEHVKTERQVLSPTPDAGTDLPTSLLRTISKRKSQFPAAVHPRFLSCVVILSVAVLQAKRSDLSLNRHRASAKLNYHPIFHSLAMFTQP
jgi:hypothetical protein